MMKKIDILDLKLKENNGFIKTSEVVALNISREYFREYIRKRNLICVARGLYMSSDSWNDDFYVLQVRYPKSIFSHETAQYLFDLAEREPTQYTLTMETGTDSRRLEKEGVKVYKIKKDLFEVGLTTIQSPAGNKLRVYNIERTICDLIRSRSNVEIQELQAAIKGYVRHKEKDYSLLMQYAKLFRVEKIIQQYLEILL